MRFLFENGDFQKRAVKKYVLHLHVFLFVLAVPRKIKRLKPSKTYNVVISFTFVNTLSILQPLFLIVYYVLWTKGQTE